MSNFETLMQQLPETNVENSIVEGVIKSIDSNYVTVDVNLKSEGLVPVSEFKDTEGKITVNVGENVAVMIELADNGFGDVFLSYEKAIRHAAWERLNKCCETGEIIEGKIIERVKGGFTVDVEPLKAFLPGSLADMRPGTEMNGLENQVLTFKVVKMDKKRSNIVVSRRAVLDEESSEEREELLANLTEGTEVTGVIKNLTEYGAFVDLGGIDGLLHITDMSWKRVVHPSDIVAVGQSVTVKVLSYDREKLRVSLGMKQLSGDPWINIAERISEGKRLFGVVTNAKDYGCFVEIEEGIEGLVHMSEMDWCNKNIQPSSMVSPGDEVEVMVLEVDSKRRRISLGMKQCVPSPWINFSENHEIGGKISGTVKSITDFGLFVGLEGGIDGLVHFTDISWHQAGDIAIRNYKKGENVDAIILAIDSERERISLGIKQLEDDPYQKYLDTIDVEESVKGTIDSVDDRRVLVKLSEGVHGTLRMTAALASVKVGDEIDVFVGLGERKGAHLPLTTFKPKAKDNEPHLTESGEHKETSLGDLLKEKLYKSDGEE